MEEIVGYFETGGALQVSEEASSSACVQGFETVPGLLELVENVGLAPSAASDGHRAAACELVLEALVAQKRISRTDSGRLYATAPVREDPRRSIEALMDDDEEDTPTGGRKKKYYN